MTDPIRNDFLLAQENEGRRLAEASDIVSLEPLGPRPYERYVVRFRVHGVFADVLGPREADGVCGVGVWFPSDYLARAAVPQVLSWLGPKEFFHPNVRIPFICIGTLRAGTPLVELCFRLHALVSYQNYGLKNPLNGAAAAWARHHIDRFPIDARPLKRRARSFHREVIEKGGAA